MYHQQRPRPTCSCGGHSTPSPGEAAADLVELLALAGAAGAGVEAAPASPATLFDAVALGGGPRRRTAGFFEILALPGEAPAVPTRAGDLLLVRALGEGGLGHLTVLTGEEPSGERLPLDRLLLRPRGAGWPAAEAAAPATDWLSTESWAAETPAAPGAPTLARPDRSVPCPPPPATVLDGFGHDSQGLTPAHRGALRNLAADVVASQDTPTPAHSICLVGHTDNTGGDAYNLALGERRASAVAAELRRELDRQRPGLAALLRIDHRSEGESTPVADNATAAGRARNRRVEIFVNRAWQTFCLRPPTAADDPTALDLHAVGERNYDGGTVNLFGRALRLRGSAFYPAASAGRDRPFAAGLGRVPVVFLLHGNHTTFHNPADRTDEACGNPGGFVPTPNHAGYVYLQRLLARMGIVAVSLDCNETNCTGPTASNINLRAGLLRETVRHFRAHPFFGGHLDLAQVGLFGHSRGGEAVLRGAETMAGTVEFADVTVRGVASLAPTDLGSLAGRPTGFAHLAMLPAFDGDVATNDGAHHYDQAVPGPFKCQLYLHDANHNFFNREWPLDERGRPERLSRPDHERLLSVYACAFFRQVLLGQAMLRFLRGDELPPAMPAAEVHISFEESGPLTVDDHENGNIAINTLNQITAQSGGLTAAEHPFIFQDPAAFNDTFFHNTVGMVAESASPAGRFRSPLATPVDLTGREVWIRAAEVYGGGGVPAGGTGYLIGVEDTAGRVALAGSDRAGGLPRPYDRRASDLAVFGADLTKTMLKTLRFPAGCFAGNGVDFTRIRAIVLGLERGDGRALAFDQLQIV